MTVGLLSFGAYLPQSRLQRSAIANAHSWFDPSLQNLARGERTMAAWDEDSNTQAVEAARACLSDFDRSRVRGLYIGSTSLPFLDRKNSAIVRQALSLPVDSQTFDIAGSQTAGTSALLAALNAAKLGETALVVGSEKRRTKAASIAEMTYGDGAAALLVGKQDASDKSSPVVAEWVGSHSESVDFVDHFRTEQSEFDYSWEARWVRDEGIMKIIPHAVNTFLTHNKMQAQNISYFCCPVGSAREQQTLAKTLGIKNTAVQDNLQSHCGNTGAAHPLLMLNAALESAKAGELIMVVGFGQGCDVLLFRATQAINSLPSRTAVTKNLKNRQEENNYLKFLTINNLITLEHGLRAETDKNTGLSTAYRNNDLTTGLLGGKCKHCGTVQIPASRVCVNPECNSVDMQQSHPFADCTASLKSYTADRLTYSISPPAYYGMIQFEQGGRIMIDFADVLPDPALQVGMPMKMVFRVKDYDHKRGFRRYYWKAAPIYSATGD
jgi:3-hydroxy-3-methylglutaryl CoA synthase